MDSWTTIPLVVGAIGSVSAFALEALVERLFAILLVIFVVGGVSVFIVTAFAWLWVKRAVGGHDISPVFDAAGSVARAGHGVVR